MNCLATNEFYILVVMMLVTLGLCLYIVFDMARRDSFQIDEEEDR